MRPIPIPLKEQNVIFARNLDSEKSDDFLINFLNKIFKEKNPNFKKIEISRKRN